MRQRSAAEQRSTDNQHHKQSVTSTTHGRALSHGDKMAVKRLGGTASGHLARKAVVPLWLGCRKRLDGPITTAATWSASPEPVTGGRMPGSISEDSRGANHGSAEGRSYFPLVSRSGLPGWRGEGHSRLPLWGRRRYRRG